MTQFQTGQRVVCIDDSFHPSISDWGEKLPVVGWVYTVRKVQPNVNHPPSGARGTGIRLVEIRNVPALYKAELYFSAWRFAILEEEAANENIEERQRRLLEWVSQRRKHETKKATGKDRT